MKLLVLTLLGLSALGLNLRPGVYLGSHSHGSFTYKVSVELRDHRVHAISVLANRTTERARRAEAVLDRVVARQSLDVDVVVGASITSRDLLAAVADALGNP